jgi:Ni/Co efflux regulator RcnB
MKTLVLAILAVGLSAPAFAQSQSCNAQAAEKKLAGAAKTSFITKCEKDAAAACDKQAAEKKLAGAAKTSFTTKCVKDAVGI